MDLEATARRFYDSINAGELDHFADLMADDFVEHEETPGLEPTKPGVLVFFKAHSAGRRWSMP